MAVARRVADLAGIDPAFQRGRRGGENGRTVLQTGAQYRHIARMIGDLILLLVGMFMLFIDNDQPEIGKWQEQRRARADNHRRLAKRDMPPGPALAPRGDVGMPFCRRHPEPVPKPLLPGRRQGDFRQQDQCLPPRRHNLLDSVEIDLGLSRAGHPIQKHRGESGPEIAGDVLHRGKLVGCWRRASDRQRARRRRAVTDKQRFQRPGLRHRRDNAGTDTGLALQIGSRQRAGQRQHIDNTAARGGQIFFRGRRVRAAIDLALRRRLQRLRLAQRHFHHRADRCHRPAGDAFKEIDKGWRQRRQRRDAGHRFQRCRRDRAVTRTEDDAMQLTRTKGNADDAATRQWPQTIPVIVEAAVKRHRDGDPDGFLAAAGFRCRGHLPNRPHVTGQVDLQPVMRYTPRVGTADTNLHRRADFLT